MILAQRFGFQGHPHATAVKAVLQGKGGVSVKTIQTMEEPELLAGAGGIAIQLSEIGLISALMAGHASLAGNAMFPLATFAFVTSGVLVPIGTTIGSASVSGLLGTSTASVSGGTSSKVSSDGVTFGATASIPVNGTVYAEQTVNTFNTNSTCTVTIGSGTANFEVSTCTQPSFATLSITGQVPGSGTSDTLIESSTNCNLGGLITVVGAGASVSSDNVHFGSSCIVGPDGPFYINVSCPSGFSQTNGATVSLNGYTQSNVVTVSTQNLPVCSSVANISNGVQGSEYTAGFTITTDANTRGILTLVNGTTFNPVGFDGLSNSGIVLIGARSLEPHTINMVFNTPDTLTVQYQCIDNSNNPIGTTQTVFEWSVTD